MRGGKSRKAGLFFKEIKGMKGAAFRGQSLLSLIV